MAELDAAQYPFILYFASSSPLLVINGVLIMIADRYKKYQDFENRLHKRNKLMRKQAKKLGITCFRIYDHDLPEFPICVEQYEQAIYVAEYVRKHPLDDYLYQEWQKLTLEIVARVTQIPSSNIFFRRRQKFNTKQEQYQKLDESKHEMIGMENGLKFKLNLQDYLDSGLFLDHRITRQMVRETAKDKDVLNLFCYTGSFSLYAAAGGAKRVDSVDMSNTYIQWTQENFKLNGLHSPLFKFIRADALQFLKDAAGNQYDIIILDPPTFSISKKMEDTFDIQRDHIWLINQCLRCLKKNGVLYFSTNLTSFQLKETSIHTKDIQNITAQTTPFDFEGKLKRYCWLIKKGVDKSSE